MARRKGLGKGLGALIPDSEVEKNILNKNTVNKDDVEDENQIIMVKLEDIVPNSNNARKKFDMESISALAESIKLYGILQPLVLLKNKDNYEIVAGERRYRAAKYLNLDTVPAIIKDLKNRDKDMISMVENIQREDLNPYEEAMAYENMMSQYNLTQLDLSKILGKSRTYIANIVRLLSLDDLTITELENGNITSSQARALLGIKDISERKKYLDLLIKKEITVNEIEKRTTKKRKVKTKDIFITDIEDRLKESLGTKVNVKKSKNRWTVNIVFTSDSQIEDFINHYNDGE